MKKHGYTFIELIVVLCILSCITAVSFPNIQSLQSYELNKKLEDATNDVIGFLNYCKAYSRANGNDLTVIISSGGIELYKKQEFLKGYTLPKGVILSSDSLWSNKSQDIKILYAVKGHLDSYSIYIVNSKGKHNKVTIKVGTWYVSRKG